MGVNIESNSAKNVTSMDRQAACLAWAYCGRGCFGYKHLRSLIAELHSWGCVRANADSGLESERARTARVCGDCM